ncbi:asparagine synthase (glutamine-hydrolyzing) [Cohnella sp. AR92]|uniref:asparagine synthase (glutamine-hydrolyzing) n=1 Tax=Cohnella sp. AR92 TaxID=648716 RepID=UPI000F8EB916|nr:asparagine synthase (glutamine-hydrolyzing) [Cohnella sp. AR92]RUS42614.1 asparagine synthase (glutamine-hydrolyzing) [Cohnella sp. AR92]
MCGLAGFHTRVPRGDYAEVLASMIEEIHHRGPDSDHLELIEPPSGGVIGLGHKRLSIIDLSDNGIQPMTSASGKTTIIFNGEIYNYRELRERLTQEGMTFRTGTDTEVILNLYEKFGEDCLRHLNGMFAFAIYDRDKDQIFVARDRLGVRPLFYSYEPGSHFAFASELKSLFLFPSVIRSINYGALIGYMRNRYASYPDTVYDGLRKLEPGHYLIYRQGQLTNVRYWDIERFDKTDMSFEEAQEELDRLLRDSIRLRMISDVPFGAYLSGGLDSSLIVAIMSQMSGQPVKTFSVGLENSRYNELGYAKVVSDLYRTDHQEFIINSKDFRDTIYKVIHYRDAPASETADIPMLLMSQQAKKKVSVVLTGEGCDELFGGYPKYAFDGLRQTFWGRQVFNNSAVSGLVNRLPYSFRKAKLAYSSLSIQDDVKRYNNWFASFSEDQVGALLSPGFKDAHYPAFSAREFEIRGHSNLDRMLYYDTKYWLSDNLLERADRMMMAASIEGRVPFLDYRLAEFAFRLKDSYKVRGMRRKFIVKKAAEKYLPKSIIHRKKIGFYMPIADWFRTEMKDFVTDHLLSSAFRNRGIFQADKVESMLNAHLNGITNHEKEIWMLLNLEIWLRTSIDRRPNL